MLLVNYKPMAKPSVSTSDGITFATGGSPMTQKDKSNPTCFQCRVSVQYSTKNSCKQEYTEKYNATKKVNETIKSSTCENNDKRSTDTPAEETSAQMLTARLKMDNFDDSSYSLMFLNNAIQNEETTADRRSGTIFLSITSHEHILS